MADKLDFEKDKVKRLRIEKAYDHLPAAGSFEGVCRWCSEVDGNNPRRWSATGGRKLSSGDEGARSWRR
jgi:hypothetical protein